MKIYAVVVTYNRLALLTRLVAKLTDIPKLTKIVIVNNGSNDGTREWLDSLVADSRLCIIHQDNVGGSGGFYTGMKAAYESGADYVWCMDDDVYPTDNCLDTLLKADVSGEIGILCPRRVMIDNKEPFATECRKLDLSNPIASLHAGPLKKEVITEPVEIEGMVFEGPLIKRELIKAIGYPNKDLFIFYDDTDYSYRAALAGYKVMYVPDAILEKERFFVKDTWQQKQMKKRWKRLYHVRNNAYFNHKYGKNVMVRYMRPFTTLVGYLFSTALLLPRKNGASVSDIRALCKAYRSGLKHQLGKIG
ncbi:MAG: glycosyltransferase family 2 protein [Muribaculaceae bacterium]|nr:glycosyltransferase family 2 protein [Muribaculaceae bacterium]